MKLFTIYLLVSIKRSELFIEGLLLPETNSFPLKINRWEMKFSFGARSIFRGKLLVSTSLLYIISTTILDSPVTLRLAVRDRCKSILCLFRGGPWVHFLRWEHKPFHGLKLYPRTSPGYPLFFTRSSWGLAELTRVVWGDFLGENPGNIQWVKKSN